MSSAPPLHRPEAMNRELRRMLGTRPDLFRVRVPNAPDVEHLVEELDADTVALINRLYQCTSRRPVWLLRHAQSCSNLVSKWDHGRHSHRARTEFKHRWFNDPALSDVGRQEALRRGRFWIEDGLPPCATIYTSFMRRAIMTAQFMAESLPSIRRIVPLPFCSEFHSNVPESPDDIMKCLTPAQQLRMDWTFRGVHGGETPSISNFLHFFAHLPTSEVPVVVSHGGFLRRLYGRMEQHHVFANTAVTSTVLIGANPPHRYTLLAPGYNSPPIRCDRCVPHPALHTFLNSPGTVPSD